jgi:hypothetical protein
MALSGEDGKRSSTDDSISWAKTWEASGHNRKLMKQIMAEHFGLDSAASDAIFEGLNRGRPPEDALSIYLDLNHWVTLAKAAQGRPDGAKHVEFLSIAHEAVSRGVVVFPLSAAHYQELANITDVRQRGDLANVMAPLSRFITLASREDRLRCEVAAALSSRTGRPAYPERLRPFGVGLGFAFGRADGVLGRFEWPDGAIPNDADPIFFEELLYRVNQLTEYILLRGPRPEEAQRIGYTLDPVRAIVEVMRAREQDLLDSLRADRADKSRIGDIVKARGLYWELGPNLPELLQHGAMSVESFFWKGREWISSFLDDISSIAVRTQLVVQADKNASRNWTRNDIYDIEALEAAVPYCDIVVTERHAAHVINTSDLAKRFQTLVVPSLAEIEARIRMAL